ncbi:MAG TPA: glutathionylspermidine synthase family protein [Verrucomicrobiae bacterium]|nr:glutathionylspermidine synthase family protein [Verrucomicrobiae bacterium]
MAHIPAFDEVYPVLGSWVIDGTAAGIGIRESFSPTTDNLSCFVPHLFE